MYEKQRNVVQCSYISHVSPDSNYVLSETTLVTTFPTHTLSSLSSETNLVLIVQLCAIATNSRYDIPPTQLIFSPVLSVGKPVQTVHQTQLSILRN